MSWFFSLVRIAGVAFPVTAPFVQLQAEIDALEMSKRILMLEDPISQLHPDVPALSEVFYGLMLKTNKDKWGFEEEVFGEYRRAIAVLDKAKIIKGTYGLGGHDPISLRLLDPTYVMYLCARFGDDEETRRIIQRLEDCKAGEVLGGKELSKELGLALPVVTAAFNIYESRGYGLLSREMSSPRYHGLV